MIEFVVPVMPVGQPRRSVRWVRGRQKSGYPVNHAIHAFKATVVIFAKQAYKKEPLTCPLHLRIEFVFPRPKHKIWKKKAMTRLRHVDVPDIDNCFKACTDALNKIIWRDDRQICSVVMTKHVAAGDEKPHLKISIEEVEADADAGRR